MLDMLVMLDISILGVSMRSYKVIPYTEDGMALAQRLRAVAHELERVTLKMLSTFLEPILHLSQYFGFESLGSSPDKRFPRTHSYSLGC